MTQELSRALDVPLHDILEIIEDLPKKKAKGSKSKKRKKAAK